MRNCDAVHEKVACVGTACAECTVWQSKLVQPCRVLQGAVHISNTNQQSVR